MPAQNAAIYRFGQFEFDSRAAELRKNGVKLKFQDQPSQVLLKLLRNPGELVTREELRSTLWQGDTFVDFENGLNTAVKRLREALSDSADGPTFIETVPRKGYRFIAPVEAFQRDRHEPRYGHDPVLDTGPVMRGRKSLLVFASACAALTLVAVILSRRVLREPRVTLVVKLTNDARVRSPIRSPVTDGLHLYFLEGATQFAGSGIRQLSAVGGETTQLATALTEPSGIYGISPDFSELLVANAANPKLDPDKRKPWGPPELWVQPLPAGTPHRVGNIYASAACYTPDGTRILYADQNSLITVNRDGSNGRELAKVLREVKEVRGGINGLHYSPDGKRIRFHISEWPFDSSSLWEIEANGSNLHELLPNWKETSWQCCGNWSPDGNYYFFQARQGSDQAIWVLPEHRYVLAGGPGKPWRLISGPLRLSAPVPSIDGKKLFVVGDQLRVEPVRYDLKMHSFESYFNSISTNVFEFSPDRQWIAYVSYPDLNLWRMRADGTDRTQLTLPPIRAYGPHWSPDGSKIAFMDTQFGRPWAVSLISSSGSPLQSFTGADPSWTPDGRSIVYWTFSKLDAKVAFAGIFRLDLDSGKTSSIPNSEGKYSSRVSPDGRYIAAFSEASTDLLLFDLKTQQWSTLLKSEQLGFNLWSPDSKYVYMRENRGSPRIVRVQILDGRVEEVVTLKGLPQVGDPATGWFGLTPDGSPIVIRDRSVQEIYALDISFH